MKNWVIVRVWLPRDPEKKFVTAHIAAASGGNVGHVSVETSEFYASFWPFWESNKKAGLVKAISGEATGVLVPNPSLDRELEKCPPDIEVVLFSLDIKSMQKKFEEFKQSSLSGRWSVMGANIFNIFKNGAGQSCSGLAYDLLNAGKIQTLITWDFTSTFWVTAPDGIARAVILAATHPKEIRLSLTEKLPSGILQRVKKPDHDLNPHSWKLGHKLGEPYEAAASLKAKL